MSATVLVRFECPCGTVAELELGPPRMEVTGDHYPTGWTRVDHTYLCPAHEVIWDHTCAPDRELEAAGQLNIMGEI